MPREERAQGMFINTMNMKRSDLIIGALVTIMWGANFSVIEMGLKALDPFTLTFLRFLCCAVPAIFFVPRPKEVEIKYLALYGTLFGAGMWWVVNFAMYNGLSAGLSSVFLQFGAFFTIILSRIIFNEKINSVHVAGMTLSVIGLIAIFLLSHEPSTTIGVGLVLLAAGSWAVCNIIIKSQKPKNMIAFIVWSSAFSAPAIFVMTVAMKGVSPFVEIKDNLTRPAVVSVLFQAYITTILGYMVWNNLMKKYPSSEVAPLSLLVPISGMLSSYFFFGEYINKYRLIAIVVVIVGIGVFMNAGKILALFKREELRREPSAS
ncbi:putative amino-acid metabolite efflux pump [Paraburkholderia nemoris]|uniref:EamA family transporter n=1 Tax=Paraburkholderia nemoris TaxID=2793076 RepID=UPI0019095F21|nr:MULTISPECIES: EamA family transporter [Paraburkholderia]MBK3787069.1 EamA family transporter [Paraburkholderia aspalathi]CAE6866284.1 putative amino-acid metabolite efflux pump [Paraburkholderia nemoris]